ncbi:MAG: helicase C-terminal domain-containing protein, partial [Terriglobales bacterium]
AVEARIHLLRQQGRNPFDEFQVPRAVLELKQGFGRLIRSSRDCGVLALLDTRISTMRYGQTFLASLPAYARTSAIADVRAFFAAASPAAHRRNKLK